MSADAMNCVGVSFMSNPSLSKRYLHYLSSSPLTCPSTLLVSKDNLVVVATQEQGVRDPLQVLHSLSQRQGFTRCSGKMFATNHISNTETEFFSELHSILAPNVTIRTHCHPAQLSQTILDWIDSDSKFKEKGIACSPTQFSHLLIAVKCDSRITWGVFSKKQYSEIIARPGDGDALPSFTLNFNRAELKLAEAIQLLSAAEHNLTFRNSDLLLAVDVGAAPGGWTKFLLDYHPSVSVVAVDPASLSADLESRARVAHLRCKAEEVLHPGPKWQQSRLEGAATKLVGVNWRQKLRLLVCDANLDVRDSVRELVVPLARHLVKGGILILTLKLGRRVGVEGLKIKSEAASKLLVEAGFCRSSMQICWLFGNSKNERTLFATKIV